MNNNELILEFEPYDRYGEKYVSYSIDAELTALLSAEIAAEIDREIIMNLY